MSVQFAGAFDRPAHKRNEICGPSVIFNIGYDMSLVFWRCS